MLIKPIVIYWFWRQVLPVTLIALPVAVGYALFREEVFEWNKQFYWNGQLYCVSFILLHSFIVVNWVGRPGAGSFAFLYTRGFSRKQLWIHQLGGVAASTLMVWLAVALVIWLRLRCVVQDQFFESPDYPVMAPKEDIFPWLWLGVYMMAIAACQYAWIRQAQPMRGSLGGRWLALLTAMAMLGLPSAHRLPYWFWYVTLIVASLLFLILLFQAYRLHQRLEVRA